VPQARASSSVPAESLYELPPDPRRRVVSLRPPSREFPEVVAIGSSTGGPQALFKVLGQLKGALRQPIFITQHMPATFTTILAEHVARASGYPTAEGVDGEAVQGGRIYVAPGDFHMVVEAKDRGEKVVRLTKAPPENFCRPSVDPMLRSLAAVYGARVLTLILTGMGHDGLNGGRAVVAAGGTVVAQDEATSIVWGMPGAVATAGLCSAVLALDEIAPSIAKLAARAAR
jgi:two-component system chemotaxis response regulator CheB